MTCPQAPERQSDSRAIGVAALVGGAGVAGLLAGWGGVLVSVLIAGYTCAATILFTPVWRSRLSDPRRRLLIVLSIVGILLSYAVGNLVIFGIVELFWACVLAVTLSLTVGALALDGISDRSSDV